MQLAAGMANTSDLGLDESFSSSPGPASPSEKEILDSVFHHCSDDGSGLVRASKIVQFLAELGKENCELDFAELDELGRLLDPNGDDPNVSIDTYQTCISHWVNLVRERNGRERSLCDSSLDSSIYLTAGSESHEGEGGDLSKSWDKGELLALFHEAQRSNRLLTEENRVLKQAALTAEEVNTTLGQETDSLRKRLGRAEKELSRRRGIEEEFEQLRAAAVDQSSEAKTARARFLQLEKEKAAMADSLVRAEDERQQLNGKLERLRDELNASHESLNSPAILVYEEQLAESIERTAHLEKCVAELTSTNESMQSERHRLEELVADLQEQQRQSSIYGRPITQSTPVRFDMRPASPSIDDDADTGSNLCNELLACDTQPELASPLVGRRNGHLETSNGHPPVEPSSLDSFHSDYSGSTIQMKSMLDPVRRQFEDRKELALRTIGALLNSTEEDLAGEAESHRQISEALAVENSEMGALYEDLEAKLKKLISSNKKHARHQKELKAAKADGVRAKNQIAELRDELSALSKQLAAANVTSSQLQQERDAAVIESEQLAEDSTAVKQELNLTIAELDRLRSELFATQADLDSTQKVCADRGRELEELRGSVRDEQQARAEELQAVKGELHTVKGELQTVTGELGQERTHVGQVKEDLDTLQSAHDNLRHDCEGLQADLRTVKEELVQERTCVGQAQEDLDASRTAHDTLRQEHEGLQADLHTVQEELAKERTHLGQAKENLNTLQAAHENLQEEHERLQADLRTVQGELHTVQGECAEERTCLSQAKEDLDTLQAAHENLRAEHEQLQAELVTARQISADLEKEIEVNGSVTNGSAAAPTMDDSQSSVAHNLSVHGLLNGYGLSGDSAPSTPRMAKSDEGDSIDDVLLRSVPVDVEKRHIELLVRTRVFFLFFFLSSNRLPVLVLRALVV